MSRLTLTQQLSASEQKLDTMRGSFSTLQAERNSLADLFADQVNSMQQTLAEQRGEISRLREVEKKIESLEKDLKSARETRDYYDREHRQAHNELEQCHAVLDGVEGAPAREYEGAHGTRQRTVVTRLAGAFLSIAKSGGAK